MSKCLITKLKAAVDNENLPKLGAIRVLIDESKLGYPLDMSLSYVQGESGTVKVFGENNGLCSASSTTITGTEINIGNTLTKSWFIFNTPGYIEISNKYGLEMIELKNESSYFDIKELKYVRKLVSVNFATNKSMIGDISVFSDAILLNTVILTSCSSLVGDISVFSDKTSITKLNLNSNIMSLTGSVESLGKLVNLSGDVNLTAPNYTGDYKRLFDALYANGKHSGTLSFYTGLTVCLNLTTYDGQSFSNRVWDVTFTEDGHTEVNVNK